MNNLIKCPHCNKEISSVHKTILTNIKHHFREVKAQLKLLNCILIKEPEPDLLGCSKCGSKHMTEVVSHDRTSFISCVECGHIEK